MRSAQSPWNASDRRALTSCLSDTIMVSYEHDLGGRRAAAVTGARHRADRPQRPGRGGDAGPATAAGAIVVCDGCSAGASSEVGARLGAQLVIARGSRELRRAARAPATMLWPGVRDRAWPARSAGSPRRCPAIARASSTITSCSRSSRRRSRGDEVGRVGARRWRVRARRARARARPVRRQPAAVPRVRPARRCRGRRTSRSRDARARLGAGRDRRRRRARARRARLRCAAARATPMRCAAGSPCSRAAASAIDWDARRIVRTPARAAGRRRGRVCAGGGVVNRTVWIDGARVALAPRRCSGRAARRRSTISATAACSSGGSRPITPTSTGCPRRRPPRAQPARRAAGEAARAAGQPAARGRRAVRVRARGQALGGRSSAT